MQNFKLFVTGHKGFETPLFHELRAILGSIDAVVSKVYGGVEISAGIDAVYLVCLHSRLANRVFCELARATVDDETRLYDAVYQVEWEKHFQARNSIAVSATLSRSKLDHAHYVALKSKDAIVDRLRDLGGSRPVVAKKQPRWWQKNSPISRFISIFIATRPASASISRVKACIAAVIAAAIAARR
jgi:23S rRNA (guanine2445-N2)-methyltransferase / 23S rRNA (guanine2069-N7)-methyltransferase